jgi:hypothetical protein
LKAFLPQEKLLLLNIISKYEISSVVNTIMRVAIIILVVGISVLLLKYFMAFSTTTIKKNRIYII